jgi:hypothetical protein
MHKLGEWRYKDANALDGIQAAVEQYQKRKEILNIIRKTSFTPQGIEKEGTIVAAHILLWLYGWWKARG